MIHSLRYVVCSFFFNDTATTEIYTYRHTLSLHDALPIAGMLDRAEQAFESIQDTQFAVPAMRALIRIYESEHDWPRAIEAVKRLRALVDEPVPQLVHYQCERAQAAMSAPTPGYHDADEIGQAPCRDRVCQSG